MDFLKRSWAQVGATFERMSFAERSLIASLAVIVLLVLGMALWFAARPQRVAVPYSGDINAAVALLQRNSIEARAEGNRLMVPVADQHDAPGILVMNDHLGGDASEAFAKLVQADPWETNAQLRAKTVVALQGYLSKVVSRMRGVRAANVMIAKPEHQGFGRTTAKPSASVMVEMRGGGEVGRDMVEAIASLVSGAVAEMNPQDVEVIDALGHSYRIDDPEDRIPTEALELVRSQEAYYQDKIERLLMIPGVIVAASVDLDPVRKEHSNTTTYTDTEPVLSESVTEVVTKDFSAGGEPGARSNAGADIASGSGVAREHSESATKTEFGSKLPVGTTVKEIAGHQIQKINVTINVPRNYFVGIYQARTPDAGAAPDEATLQPIIDEQLARITEKVEPVITKGDAKGAIYGTLVYVGALTAAGGVIASGGAMADGRDDTIEQIRRGMDAFNDPGSGGLGCPLQNLWHLFLFGPGKLTQDKVDRIPVFRHRSYSHAKPSQLLGTHLLDHICQSSLPTGGTLRPQADGSPRQVEIVANN